MAMLVAAGVALLWANSNWAASYDALLSTEFIAQVGTHRVGLNLKDLVSEGLMALFFLVVSLEIKRELLEGELQGLQRATLPLAAALGGMVVPGLAYLSVAGRVAPQGWAIPIATDIAFALAVLYVLGDRVGAPLKALLLAVAIVDDLLSILVIAVFYSGELHLESLGIALCLVALIGLLHRLRVRGAVIHSLLGILLWAVVHESGVHATLAGVALAVVIPIRAPFPRRGFLEELDPLATDFRHSREERDIDRADATLGRIEYLVDGTESSLDRALRKLSPVVAVTVLPLFALANAGVAFSFDGLVGLAASPVAVGIGLGLLVGKPLGFVGGAWAVVRLGWARLPEGTAFRDVAGLGFLAGIGFTISLFITELAFSEPGQVAEAKIAILTSSVLAGTLGLLALALTLSRRAGEDG